MRTEKTREQLIEENPQLQQVDPDKYDGRKVAAKNIRTELKASFPGIKFSVRGESFAGGDSIDVRWGDGPTVKEVDSIISKYQYGRFDGMQDMYVYGDSLWCKVFGDAKYVHGERKVSAENEMKVAKENNIKVKLNSYGYVEAVDQDGRNELSRLIYSTSFYVSPEKPKVEKYEKSHTITNIIKNVDVRKNEKKNGIEVVFESKPESEVLKYLKSKGFRWSKFSKLWYNRYSENLESELKVRFSK